MYTTLIVALLALLSIRNDTNISPSVFHSYSGYETAMHFQTVFKEIAAVFVVELNLTSNIIITYFGAIFSKDFILSLRVLLKQHQEFPIKSC